MEGYKENVSDHVPDHSYVEWNLQRHLIAANHSIIGLHLADHGCQLQKLLKHFKLHLSVLLATKYITTTCNEKNLPAHFCL